MNFTGKVAIVTGGANGIGKSISTALLNKGLKLCICDINESAANLFLDGLSDNLKSSVIFAKCDVSSADEFRAAFEKTLETFGKIDVVVNNAGIMNEHQWKKVVDVNFIGVIYGIQLAFEFMGTNNGGAGGYVINTASVGGLSPFALGPIYCGTKHAVVGLTKSYGQPFHFERTGVTVNAVCPGPIDTQMCEAFPARGLDDKAARELLSQMILISPDEIGKGVVKLLQDGKNGALLIVDHEGARYEEYVNLL